MDNIIKNSEIHNGFPLTEIRDFLSMSIVKIYEDELTCKKEKAKPNNADPFQYSIDDQENEIKYRFEMLNLTKEKQAIFQLIKKLGWSEYDVSDETAKDTNYKMWMSFLGTKDEYDQFISSIERK